MQWVYQSILFYGFFHSGLQGSWCLSPEVYGQYTLDRSPVHCRATQKRTSSFIPKCNLEKPLNLTVIFLDWEKAGVLGKNPRMHGENMQTPCRKRVEHRTFLLQGNSATNC
ncbi:hypothetical protein ILYODFUR_012223, partial [Ilyodon furcidens]